MLQRLIQKLGAIRREISEDTLPDILKNPIPYRPMGRELVQQSGGHFFFPYESHKYYELAVQLSGSSVISCGKNAYRLEENQILLIDRDVKHRLGVPEGGPVSMLWVAATNDTIRPGVSHYNGGERQKRWGMDILAPGGYLLREAISEMNGPDAASAVTVYLAAFLTMLIQKLAFAERMWDSDRKAALVRQIQGYIDTHLAAPLTLGELSGLASVSPSYLCKVFKQITGETVFSYIQDAKIRAATNYLVSTDKELSEISDLLGFYDQFHFSKTFKTYMGMAPTSYRATYRARGKTNLL